MASFHPTFVDQQLLAAVLAQIVLTLALLVRMGFLRVRAISTRQVRMSEIALSNQNYPDMAKKAGKALDNQFQLPMLFYFVTSLLFIVGPASTMQMMLAWAFVISRFVHAYIHTHGNNVTHRFGAYLLGVFILTAYILSVFFPVFF